MCLWFMHITGLYTEIGLQGPIIHANRASHLPLPKYRIALNKSWFRLPFTKPQNKPKP